MINIINEVLAGVIAGLILAPLFFMVVGMLGYNKTQKDQRKMKKAILENHTKEINNIKKEYERKHDRYMKLRTKLVRYVDKIYEKHRGVEQ
jgi:hypothetical protein